MSTDEWPREENGFAKGLAETLGPDARTYRVVFWKLQGQHDLFLTRRFRTGIFQQSLVLVDEKAQRVRYRAHYVNGQPTQPAR